MSQQEQISDCMVYRELVMTNINELLSTPEMTGCCTLLILASSLTEVFHISKPFTKIQ